MIPYLVSYLASSTAFASPASSPARVAKATIAEPESGYLLLLILHQILDRLGFGHPSVIDLILPLIFAQPEAGVFFQTGLRLPKGAQALQGALYLGLQETRRGRSARPHVSRGARGVKRLAVRQQQDQMVLGLLAG